jgi:hypothetical protein
VFHSFIIVIALNQLTELSSSDSHYHQPNLQHPSTISLVTSHSSVVYPVIVVSKKLSLVNLNILQWNTVVEQSAVCL